MSRIVYGVMGDHLGHLSRALAVAGHMTGHEILFVGGGHVLKARDAGYRVHEVPVPSTVLRQDGVDVPRTVAAALRCMKAFRPTVRGLADLIENFGADFAITDYELHVPRAASMVGVPCLSLDHQHVLTHARQPSDRRLPPSGWLTRAIIRGLYSVPEHYLISSFFAPEPLDRQKTEIVPPVLREDVQDVEAQAGDHVLLYLHQPPGESLLRPLLGTGRRLVVYGADIGARSGVSCRAPSREGFLKDLATCAYVVTGGGHSLLSEAFHLGKPCLCAPPDLLFEQHLNACFARRLGYGEYLWKGREPGEAVQGMEDALDRMGRRLPRGRLFGNATVAGRVLARMG